MNKLEKILAEMESLNAIANERDWTDEERAKFGKLEQQFDDEKRRQEFSLKAKAEEAQAKPKVGFTEISVGEDLATQKPWRNLGEQLQAVKAACVGGIVDPRLHRFGVQSEGVPSEGGFLVDPTFSGALIGNLGQDPESLMSYANVITVGENSNGMVFPVSDNTTADSFGGVTATWEGEGHTMSAVTGKLKQLNLRLEKLTAYAIATDELLQDSTALNSWLSGNVNRAFQRKLNKAIVNGSGIAQPLGIRNSDVLVSVAKKTGQTATTVVIENFSKMLAYYVGSRAGARFIVGRDTYDAILAFTGGNANMFTQPGSVASAPQGALFGIPFVISDDTASLGSAGDVLLADMLSYIMIVKGGMQSAASIHIYFDQNKTAFRWTMRVNGAPDPQSIEGTTKSRFLAVAVRS